MWVVAFTDPSYDRNQDSNYQLIELLGDRVLYSVFNNLAVRKYPQITEELLTLVNNRYMSKIKQSEMSKQLGLAKWIRTNIDLTIHTHEDLFESMFGMLFKICDLLIGNGNGYAFCSNLITNLYYDLTIDLDEIMSDPITQIKEIFEKLNWTPKDKFKPEHLGVIRPNNDPLQPDHKWLLELRLNNYAINFIQTHDQFRGKKLEIILARVSGKDKKSVQAQAFAEALKTLHKYYGIDYKWAEKYADDKMDKEARSIAGAKMDNDRIKKLFFPKSVKSTNKQFLQLVGITPDGRSKILLTVVSDFDIPLNNLKSFALYFYATSNNININNGVEYDQEFLDNLKNI
jgi:hypothetical protein